MLDINLFIKEKGGNPDLIKESQKRRGADPEIVDVIVNQYKEWTATRFLLDEKNKQMNGLQKEIGKLMKAKQDAKELLAQKAQLAKEKGELEVQEKEQFAEVRGKLGSIGNVVHDSVPISLTEDDNQVVRTHWVNDVEPVKRTDFLNHHEVLTKLGGFDPVRGAKISGHRGYFLTDVGVDLNLALINYGLAFLSSKGYKKLQTPFLMNKDIMSKCAQLSQYDEELYKVVGSGTEDKYLIATSEQPISAYHMGEWFENPSKQLPLKYAGYSTCFRKEAGAHGKDAMGLFRVHQFEKIEQFVLTEPEKSWEMFDSMISTSEEFFQSLGISYQVVAIVSGALNDAAAKKFDLEAWFPAQGAYKELVSCSNCTDYQSRRLDIRCGTKKMGDREKKYVHCLNSTLCATERALCCLLETHQTPDGINIPEPLIPFMGGRDFIPYIVENTN
ncbi:Serine-tRNA ligase, cytoplasmic [Zancudomyces culisetae]|uniref:serine--tRNA ligase n=1 Tax=Zancudomyces culisetae TaxID=1213189 RepID=A0A1R1PRR8_ZANCU|nr:Serine-tRNA ligase, cytoplasmic [Zancudomyces culisetae]|eukprot:OMH83675.1 Serine-tRNA ligase, cytoplasmic [Zancudomyces culisetae]